MKKIFPFFLLVLLLASCQKDPDMSKLDNDFLVFTNHDKDEIRIVHYVLHSG